MLIILSFFFPMVTVFCCRDEPEAPSREDFGTRRVVREERRDDGPRRDAPTHSAASEGRWERGINRRPDPAPAPSAPSASTGQQDDDEKWETAGSKGRGNQYSMDVLYFVEK